MTDPQTFFDDLVAWAAKRQDVRAVGLAGSWARGTATPNSDVDLILIVNDVKQLLDNDRWLTRFGDSASVSDEDWGILQSRRVHYVDGLEVEFGLTTEVWAALPLDAGTRRVVADGFAVLYDPDQVFQHCTNATR